MASKEWYPIACAAVCFLIGCAYVMIVDRRVDRKCRELWRDRR